MTIVRCEHLYYFLLLVSDENIVNSNVNQLDKETNKAHDQKSNASCTGNGSKFFSVRFGAFLDQVHRVLGELLERLHQDLIESLL